MGAGRPLPQLVLTVEENNRLVEWARRRTTAQALALRARIVLTCAQGATNTQVSERLRVTLQTVGKWRRRFVDQPETAGAVQDDIETAVIKLVGGNDLAEASGPEKGRRLSLTAGLDHADPARPRQRVAHHVAVSGLENM